MDDPTATLTYALGYVARGWPVIQWPAGTKGAKQGGWQKKATTDPEKVKRLFNGDGQQNVGVLLGNGLCDVDLDCPEALAAAGYFLPETGVMFGRQSSRMAHRIYRSDAAETIKKAVRDWEDPEHPGKPMLELRVAGGGKAAQTIFPGSVHTSGERIEFEAGFDREPAEVGGADLIRACQDTAAASLVARAWPVDGGHRPAQVIGGFLARVGWDAPRVELFARAVMAHVNGEHAGDHARTARNAAEAHANGGNTFGFPKLAETFGEKRAKAIAKWLGYDARSEAKPASGDAPGSHAPHGGTKADMLIDAALAEGLVLYHAPDGTGFADMTVGGHVETWGVRSSAFKRWLRRVFYQKVGGAPGGETLESAVGVLEAKAQFDGGETPVYLRCAEHDGVVYIDLCDADWRMVVVTPDGWRIISAADAPCRFRRSNTGMLPLPAPVQGGSIDELREHLNTTTAVDFILAVSWVLASLRGRGPYPILAFAGEQGTGKSTACRILRGLVDPFKAPIRAMPKDKRDLAVTAHNAHVIGLDNLSGIAAEMSDALCSLSTGGGFATRGLYSNDEEHIFEATRPIILNGIDDVATRGDLADRAVLVTLKPITDATRKTEAAVWKAFEKAAPRIFGAVLDALAHGLKMLPVTKLASMPRMADYALWVAACEGGIWKRGEHMRAYTANRRQANEIVLEADPVAGALRQHMQGRDDCTTTLPELLAAISGFVPDHVKRTPGLWPQTARGLTSRLARLAPALRSVGITVSHVGQDAVSRRQLLRIERTPLVRPGEPSESSEASKAENRDDFQEVGFEGLPEGSGSFEGLAPETEPPARTPGEDDDPYNGELDAAGRSFEPSTNLRD